MRAPRDDNAFGNRHAEMIYIRSAGALACSASEATVVAGEAPGYAADDEPPATALPLQNPPAGPRHLESGACAARLAARSKQDCASRDSASTPPRPHAP